MGTGVTSFVYKFNDFEINDLYGALYWVKDSKQNCYCYYLITTLIDMG